MKNTTVMWVGLSAKKVVDASDTRTCAPLHVNTNTGKLVAEIEARCHPDIRFFKTNLVGFPPLDSRGKLRYPTLRECALCYPELQNEILAVNPRVVLLLGNKTATFVLCQLGLPIPKLSYRCHILEHEKRWYVSIYHPSYILVYKRKEKDQYVRGVKAAIERLVLR